MADTLRVLYVDDEPGLLTIGKLFLERSGDFSVATVCSASAALELLKKIQFDVIISDYLMPEMDGIAFLKQLKASGNITPFIIFTGKGREEVVIEALNEGADFYLQKGGDPKAQFAELANKIRYAVSRRKAELDLRASEERYRHVVEDQTEFICRFLPDGTHIFVNEAYCRYFGTNRDEITGTRFRPAIHPEDREHVARLLASLTMEHPLVTIDQRVIMPDGSIRWQRWVDRGIFQSDGSLKEYQSVGRDITDWKQAEEEIKTARETYLNIFLNSQIGLFRVDVHTGLLLDANDAVARFIGYPDRASLLATPFNIMEWYVDPDDHDRITSLLLSDGEFHNYEARFRKNDGSILWIRFSGRLVKEKGWVEGVSEDITERKVADMALHDSELKYRSLIESSSDAIFCVDQNGAYKFTNLVFASTFDKTPDFFIGKTFWDIYPKEHADYRQLTNRRVFETGVTQTIEVEVPLPDTTLYFIAKANPIKDETGKVILNLTHATDITGRKQAEEALQRQSVTLSILNAIITTANKADDLPELLNNILDESLNLLDFDAGGIYLVDQSSRTANVVHSKNISPEFLDEIRTLPIDKKPYDTLFIQKEPIITDNYEQIAPERSKRFGFQSMASIPLLSKGVVIGALNVVSARRYVISEWEKLTLISIGRELGSTIERMTSEEKAKKVSENLETLFNSIDEMVFVLDMQGCIIVVNEAVQKRLSYKPGELTGKNILLLLIPERRDEALRIVQGMIAGTIDSCPVPVLAKDGTHIEVETKVTRGRWNSQEVLIGVTRDITGRKRAEEEVYASRDLLIKTEADLQIHQVELETQAEELKMAHLKLTEARDKYLDLYEFAPVGYLTLTYDALIAEVNLSGATLLGTDRNKLEQARFRKFIAPQDLGMWDIHFMNILDQDTKKTCTLTLKREDGSVFPARLESVRLTGINNSTTTVRVAISDISDISDIRLAEEALAEREKVYRSIFNNFPDLYYQTDLNGIITRLSPSITKLSGWVPEELIGHLTTELYPFPEERDGLIETLSRTGAVQNYEITLLHKDGRHLTTSISGHLLYDDAGKATAIEGTIRDISERKRADEKLRHISDRLSLATRAGGVGIWDYDVVTNTLTWDDQMFALYGITREQFGGAYEAWQAGLHPDDRMRGDTEIQMALRGEKEFDTEFRVLWPDGSIHNIRAFAIVQRDTGGKPLHMLGTNWDITARKQTEDALALASRKLNLLSTITRHDINNQLTVLMGYLDMLESEEHETSLNAYFKTIATAAERIAGMIQFTKEYESIGVAAPSWQDCRTHVDTATKDAHLGKVLVKNDLSAGMEVFADPLVVKVFYNLMDNAVRYGGKITMIRFSALERDGDLVIVCEDDGVGVPVNEKEKIFERGFGKNTGLGLTLSSEILSISGITIRETGEQGTGARFEMTVPKGAFRTTPGSVSR